MATKNTKTHKEKPVAARSSSLLPFMWTGILWAASLFTSTPAFAQGQINFATTGGPPILTSEGEFATEGYSAALYYAPYGTTDEGLFVQVGAAVTPLGEGWVLAYTRTVPDIPPRLQAAVQVRAWNNDEGTLPTYEAALVSPLGEVGASGIFQVVLGGPSTFPPANILGPGLYQGIQLSIVPEPSVLRLSLLGLGAFLLGGLAATNRGVTQRD